MRLLKHINRDKFDPVVILPEGGPMVEEFEKINVKYYISPLERWIRFKFDNPIKKSTLKSRVEKISEIIKSENPDIVHSNTSVILEGAIAAKLNNINHVWHIHEFFTGSHELHPCLPINIIKEIILYTSSKIICVSDFVKKQFKDFPDEKIQTIYNGVESNDSKMDLEFRRKLGITDDEIIVVSIGLLNENKGSDNLLKAAALVKEKVNNVKFIWIGNGTKEEIKKFRRNRKKLKLKDSVHLLEHTKEIPQILKSSNILVCTSLVETLSLAIVEGMAAGLPIITTDCGGPSECIDENINGFIIPVNDPNILCNRILEISRNPEIQNTFGSNSLIIFDEKFTIKKYVFSIENLYRKVMKEKIDDIANRDVTVLNSMFGIYDEVSNQHWNNIN